MAASYQGAIECLASFKRIFVTGPQRSGTMVVSAALAHDLAYWFYPEEQIRVYEWWRVERLFGRTNNFVLQTPALCYLAHKVPTLDPNAAVVLVRRDIEDIIASERRIEWTGAPFELKRYGLKEGIISEVKYAFWDEHQKALIPNAFEVDYESLASHPLWIPKECRMNFGPRQYKE